MSPGRLPPGTGRGGFRRPGALLPTGALLPAVALLGASLAGCEPPASAGSASGPTADPPPGAISVHRGAAPSLRFDPEGRLWAAFEQDGFVWVAASADAGRSYSPPVRVPGEAEAVETNGENRPKIFPTEGGLVYVSWTRKLAGRFTGEIRFSRSTDGGRSFEAPRTVNDDGLPIGHRFDSLHVDALGHVYLVWIDKRDREGARAQGRDYRGAAIYYAVSTDRGATFGPNRRIADHACECCRIAIADAPGGGSAVLWRHIFEPNLRDHAFTVLGPEGLLAPVKRATWEGWELDGCPHHGPAMVPDGATGYHLAWFTGAGGRPTIYYGHYEPGTGVLSAQTALAGPGGSHPDLERRGDELFVVWKQFEAGESGLRLARSRDGGSSWETGGSPVVTTSGGADHPFLVAGEGGIFSSWHTEEDGLFLIPAR